ncbi:MAG: hypothetical protein HQK84_03130 [Nitrospinae bacterium]|nr:hypothetical protein [Nitrospinota bacterium]
MSEENQEKEIVDKIPYKRAFIEFFLRLSVIIGGVVILLIPIFLLLIAKLRGPEF